MNCHERGYDLGAHAFVEKYATENNYTSTNTIHPKIKKILHDYLWCKSKYYHLYIYIVIVLEIGFGNYGLSFLGVSYLKAHQHCSAAVYISCFLFSNCSQISSVLQPINSDLEYKVKTMSWYKVKYNVTNKSSYDYAYHFPVFRSLCTRIEKMESTRWEANVFILSLINNVDGHTIDGRECYEPQWQ